MSLQSNHFPETLDTPEAGGVAVNDAVRDAVGSVLLLYGFDRCDAAAVATMTAGCCETIIARVLNDATYTVTDDGEPPPF